MKKLTLKWLLENDIIDINRIAGIIDESNGCYYDFYGSKVEKWIPETEEISYIKIKSDELLKLNSNKTIIKISTEPDGGIILILDNVNEVEE